MKGKIEKAKILTKDLIKYSQQINLSPIPRLVFNSKDWDEIAHSKRKTRRDRWMGLSCRPLNLIMVNLDYQGPVSRKQYGGTKHNRYYKIIASKWNLTEAKHTLIHELVHIKWTMKHGYEFAKRIDDISKGKKFN